MRTSVYTTDVAGCPVEELATSASPAALRELGTHCRDGSWVIAGAADVRAALSAPALSVAPAASPEGAAAQLLARMARFTDGAEHGPRRELLLSMLPSAPQVAAIAAERASEFLAGRESCFDIMPMARELPAEALALALGLPPAAASRAATLTGTLCDAVSPANQPRTGTRSAGDAAAVELADVMADGLGSSDTGRVTAAISILFQARDATAALIGTTVLARDLGFADAGERVDDVLRREGPVQCTRRTPLWDTTIGAAQIPAGESVWIFVATAEDGTGTPATFGSGPHACPAAAQAAAIAGEVTEALAAAGWRPVPGQDIDFEPRPNLRMPARVLVVPR